MPKPTKNKKVLSLDTETTGLDLHHMARPFLVTMCYEDGPIYWEWDVNPLNRQPVIPEDDLKEIESLIADADEIVFQNGKYDIQALIVSGFKWPRSYYQKCQDLIYGDHILYSGEKRSLDNQTIRYLGVDISRFEKRTEAAAKEARKLVQRDVRFAKWMIARPGIPGMPSIKASGKNADEKPWKNDLWLMRTLAKELKLPQGIAGIANIKNKEPFDVYIGRPKDGQPWRFGNPFVIGEDGDRQTVIEKHRNWLKTGNNYGNRNANTERRRWILDNLKELDGKTLGCFCDGLCHGQNYAELLPRHEWWYVTSDYANADSSSTYEIWKVQQELLKRKKLWNVYLERRKLIKIITELELNGLTYSQDRMNELRGEFQAESDEKNQTCLNLSGGKLEKLPESGTSKAMLSLMFDTWKCPVIEASEKTGVPSLKEEVLEKYTLSLPRGSKALAFVSALRHKRKRDASIGFMDQYEKFSIKVQGFKKHDIRVIHPFINPASLVTLRMSSSNPNGQNISKDKFEKARSVRYCFGPAPGREWWSLDYKNIELRIPAYEANEEDMIQLFERPNDPPYYGSNHLVTFSTLYPELWAKHGAKCKDLYKDTLYQWVKSGNFAIACGASETSTTADDAFHFPGAQKLIRGRFVKMAVLKDKIIDHANEFGYVETMYDRSVGGAYPIQIRRNSWGKVSPTQPFSYHVQSTAMWAMCKAMGRVADFLDEWNSKQGLLSVKSDMNSFVGVGGFITMQIHDELLVDLPKGETYKTNFPVVMEIKRLMEMSGTVDLGIPLEADYSYHPNNWDEKEETE